MAPCGAHMRPISGVIAILKGMAIRRGTTIALCAAAPCAAHSAQRACRQGVTTTSAWWLWVAGLTGSQHHHHKHNHHYYEVSAQRCSNLP